MQWLADMIIGALRWVLDLVVAIFKLLKDVVIDAFCYILDGVGSFIVDLFGKFDLNTINAYAENVWSGVPGELLNMAVSLGLGEAMAIIGAAITIRLLMQLIPFTRLGS